MNLNPTDIFHGHHPDERGRSATVRINVNIPRTRCQALEYMPASDQDAPFKTCPHPPFALVSAGRATTTLCWRHLCTLGDTGELTVQPWTGMGRPIVKLPGNPIENRALGRETYVLSVTDREHPPTTHTIGFGSAAELRDWAAGVEDGQIDPMGGDER